jgi:uncharacterized protein YrrD
LRLLKVPGLPVVDTHVARQAGVVSDVLLDLVAGRVAVLHVRHADGWLLQRIPAAYIHRLGPEMVLVSDTVAVDLGPSSSLRWFAIGSVVGLDVMTNGGDRVGQITDADLDGDTLSVRAYFLKNARGVWRRRGQVRADEVVSCSGELMLVRDGKPE